MRCHFELCGEKEEKKKKGGTGETGMYGTTGKEIAALGSYYRRRRSGNHHHPEREGKPATPRRANTRGKVVRTSIPRPRPAVDPGRAPASGRERA